MKRTKKTSVKSTEQIEMPKKITKFGMAMEKYQGLVKILDRWAVMK